MRIYIYFISQFLLLDLCNINVLNFKSKQSTYDVSIRLNNMHVTLVAAYCTCAFEDLLLYLNASTIGRRKE